MMRLLGAELTDVRRFSHLQLTFEEGLNLILGPNGAGKSTLAEAIMFAFTERYGNEGVRARLAPIDRPQARPRVVLTFEIDGTRYELVKQFGGSRGRGECTLQEGSTLLAGDDAQRRLTELLHFVEPTGRKANLGLQQGIPRLFWVEQGRSTDVEGAFQAVRSFLEPLLGLGTAVELEAAAGDLRRRVEAELRAVEGTGRSESQLRVVDENLERLRQQLEELRNRDLSLEEARGRLQQAESELKQISAQGQVLRLQQGLADAEAYAQEIRRLQRERDRLEGACMGTRQQLEILSARRDRAAELDQVVLELEVLEHDLVEEEAAEQAEAERMRELEERLAVAREESSQVEQSYARRELVDRRNALLRQRHELEERLTRLDELQATRQALEARLQELEVGEGTGVLAEREQELMIAEARLHAGTARVRVEVHSPQGVLLDGRVLVESTEFRLESSRVIEVPDRVRVDLSPQHDADQLRRHRDELRDQLQQALALIGAANVQEVRGREEERARCEQGLASCAAAEAAIGIRANLERQHAECVRTLEILPPPRPEDEALASLDELRVVRQRAKEAEEALGHQLEALIARRKGRQDALRGRQDERLSLQVRRDQLARDLAASPYDPDECARLSAKLRHDEEELHQVETQLGEREDPEVVIVRARERLEALNQRIAQLEATVSAESRLVQTLWPEQSERELEEEIELLLRRRRELKLRASGLKLIIAAIDEIRRDQRETLEAPVRERIAHYLVGLAAGAAVELDDALGPKAVVLPDVRFGFEQLSYGTREQVALASRLAFADVLADKGTPLIVMLDDALLHADLVRLDWMKGVLLEASTRHQLLLFSCRPDLFADLRAHRVALERTTRQT